jgi:hypothetical protein
MPNLGASGRIAGQVPVNPGFKAMSFSAVGTIEAHRLEADFWGISVTSGDPLLSRIGEVSDVGWRIIGVSSDELVSNSPGLYPSHDETFW